MTLRQRLLMVYLIVVLLSVATVSVAIYELNRTQNIYGPLHLCNQAWALANQMAETFPKVALLPATQPAETQPAATRPGDPTNEERMLELIAEENAKLNEAGQYIDVEALQTTQINLHLAYRKWREAPSAQRAALAQDVQDHLSLLKYMTGAKLDGLKQAAEDQQTTKWLLPGLAIGLGALHVMVIGWLLRRWLLGPLERLNRQVEALAKDQPPAEPLLTSPLEMAQLASALDRARQSLQEYRQQLLDNERLTTIGQFAAQLAHNLRNPLASIRAAAQVTARHERGNEYVSGRMDEVMACVDRLNQWVVRLMEVAKRDPAPTGSTDVVPLLERVHEAVKPDLAIKELTLAVEAPAEGLVCVHDPATLEQALIAMVVNAIEASPLGRKIVVKAERVELRGGRGEGERGGLSDGEKERGREGETGGLSEIRNPQSEIVCRISVNDEGPGLPVEHPERIFEFSYSTKQKGMGLGLALARLALERQGGQAHACNRAEGGAMVYVELPLGESQQRTDEVRSEK